jgi:phosphatidylserine/phosphatidylglycerophosphate/cardiolipin synthase-like enzyme
MKKLTMLLQLALMLLALSAPAGAFTLTLNGAPAQVYFSPGGGCTEAIAKEITGASNDILVQAYSFTSAPIAKALVDAHKRGVRVEVILDASQRTEKYSAATFLANAKIPTFIDDKHAIAHNKIIIIDGETVITGSFNFTRAAEERNAENLVIIKSREFAKPYLDNWTRHRQHSETYAGRY